MNAEQFQEVSLYNPKNACVFKKVKEEFGGFSNMSNDFRVRVNGLLIYNTEALYQACRYPHLSDVQKIILEQKSGMSAKMKSKSYRKDHSREDWEAIKIEVMRWCLKVKLAQNVFALGRLLDSTGEKAIIEHSHNDQFWGATLDSDENLQGQNVLGKLLMELRENYRQGLTISKKNWLMLSRRELIIFICWEIRYILWVGKLAKLLSIFVSAKIE